MVAKVLKPHNERSPHAIDMVTGDFAVLSQNDLHHIHKKDARNLGSDFR